MNSPVTSVPDFMTAIDTLFAVEPADKAVNAIRVVCTSAAAHACDDCMLDLIQTVSALLQRTNHAADLMRDGLTRQDAYEVIFKQLKEIWARERAELAEIYS